MKKFAKKLLFPPLPLILLLSAASGWWLWKVFSTGQDTSLFACCGYVLSFYTLTVLCLYAIFTLPGKLPQWKTRIYRNPFLHRYLTDGQFRAGFSLYLSLCLNLTHACLQAFQWYHQKSWWFVILAGYYTILSVMRFLLAGYVRRHTIGADPTAEWKRSRVCGWILLLVNLTLSAAVGMMVFRGQSYHYGEIAIYAIALYTFYAVIHALREIWKGRHLRTPVVTTGKVVSLSAALVSLLNLESGMLNQFGQDLSSFARGLYILLTGIGVSVIILTLSGTLIARATKEIRSANHGTQ